MAKRGRPKKEKEDKKLEVLFFRLNPEEKQAFKDAANVSGIPLSAWVRERLRQAAIKDLDAVGHPISFFKKIKWGD